MPQSLLKNGQKRRKKLLPKATMNGNRASKLLEDEDDDEDFIVSGDENSVHEQSESDDETAQAKRLRIAKQYIQQLESEEKEKHLDEEINKDAIAHRLRQEVMEDAGRLQKFIADQIEVDESDIKMLHGHRSPVTCIVITADDSIIFSAAKDGCIIKWNACTCNKMASISGLSKKAASSSTRNGHVGQVLCLAISSDSQFLASAGQDTFINIWNPVTLAWMYKFRGHRNIITGLAFQQKQHQLFSASHDKSVKVWNLDEMAYVETLFGHEDAVLGVDSLFHDRAVSCGGRDRSIRLWKIPEESQLVFQSTSSGSSFDCITMLNEDYFLAGGDDGSLSIFSVRKKKPVTFRTNAHVKTDLSPQGCCSESWITSVASLPYTDLVASGSCDGCLKLWKCEKFFKAIKPIINIKINGFVNSLRFSSKGDFLVAGVGQEHRLGRWWRMSDVKNSICIIPLKRKDDINNKDVT